MMLHEAMSHSMLLTGAIVCGCVLDLIFADPVKLPHPVVIMGSCIRRMEHFLRSRFPAGEKGELAGGRILAALLPPCVFVLTGAVCMLSWHIHPALFFAVESIWCAQALAARGLANEARAVKAALKRKDAIRTAEGTDAPTADAPASIFGDSAASKEDPLNPARRQVARIVGRDTDSLDEAGIIRACVETVAENSSDGVIAPLLYMLIGGAPLALAYKAINTMDSMIGYRNDRYLYFGAAAAKLDDIANYLPSRIAALGWIAAACADPSSDGPNAWRIFRRDRRKHASPNAAQTESACAGALHIALAGPASYFGRLHQKPWIGDNDRPVEAEDISRSVRLMWIAGSCVFAAGIGIRLLILLR